MNPAAEVALVAQREIRKNVRSAKGLALLGLSVLGAVGAALAFSLADAKQHEEIARKLASVPPEQVAAASAQLKQGLIAMLGGNDEALGEALSKAPFALYLVLKATVWLGPAVVALIGFDAMSGELQYRTVRFWTLRTRRASFYVGKLLGTWTVVSMLTLLVQAFAWAALLSRGETAGKIVEWGPRFWLATLPISLVWCAIAQLVASQFRAPIVALISTFASFFGLWIGNLLSARLPALGYLYPSSYDDWLVHPHLDRALGGLAICVGSAVAYTVAGAALFEKADV
jgi:ABC-2 type transport system permease protein